MKNQINLASVAVDTKRTVRKIFLISIVVFTLCFCVSAILLMITLFQTNEIATLTSQKTQLESSITSQKESITNAAIIKDRLSAISKIIGGRFDVNTKITAFLSLLPESVTITSVEANTDKITFTVVSSDLSIFDELLDTKLSLLDVGQVKGVKRIDIGSFRLDKKLARYSLALNFNLDERIVKAQ